MSNTSDVLSRARGDLQQAGAKAQQLAAALKTAAESQRNDARQVS